MSVTAYQKNGTKRAVAPKLPKAVFAVEVTSTDLIKQAYEAYRANGRANIASTKTRGDVRGGGKKPWRQKGTGRARFGSTRVPQWRHGGVVFGPTGNENYQVNLPRRAKVQALAQALSLAAGRSLKVIEGLENSTGKTSVMHAFLKKIGADSGRVVIVATLSEPAVIRSLKNLAYVEVISPARLSVYHVMNADHIVITEDAITAVSTRIEGADQ